MVHQSLTRRQALLTTASLGAALGGCATPAPTPSPPSTASPARAGTPREAPEWVPRAPAAPREFRAAWVATVANIDWPSKKGLSAAQQQAEARAIVERAAALGLNALILQVRTSADAFYRSALEPWSEYLSGTQGADPGYDPLAYWIDISHAAGLELHAWFNPYRARQLAAQSAESPTHLANTQPAWVKRYGKQLWIDPGEPGAVAHSLAVFRDVLTRYPVDGLHIDDYFYPYPEKDAAGSEIDFPDEPSWQAHGAASGLSRADWRRRNVDELVKALYALVREVRPAARLGISPFGLMKPAVRPAGISGFSQYDKLYADVERWLAEGWLDYLVPQLYWPRAQTAQAFEPLLQGWQALNPLQRPIWPGLFTSRINDTPASWQPDEVLAQIELTRQYGAQGHAHFSAVALVQDRKGVATRLQAEPYAQAALAPALPWITAHENPPAPLRLHAQGSDWRLAPEVGTAAPLPLGNGARAHAATLLAWRLPPTPAQAPGSAPRWRLQRLGPQQNFRWPQDADALVASAISSTGLEGPRRAWSLLP